MKKENVSRKFGIERQTLYRYLNRVKIIGEKHSLTGRGRITEDVINKLLKQIEDGKSRNQIVGRG